MEPGEIWSSSEVGAFGDQNLFDQLEVIDDNARGRTQVYAEDVAVNFAKCRECLERGFVSRQKVHAADEWPRLGPRYRRGGLLRPREPPHQQHHTQTD